MFTIFNLKLFVIADNDKFILTFLKYHLWLALNKGQCVII